MTSTVQCNYYIHALCCMHAVDYMTALAEGGGVDVRYLRVMLIGPSGVGKTSLLDRMMGNEPSSGASSTKMAVTHNLWAKAKHGEEHWRIVSEEDKIKEIAKLLQKVKMNKKRKRNNVKSDQSNDSGNTFMSSKVSDPVDSNPEIFSPEVQHTTPMDSAAVDTTVESSDRPSGDPISENQREFDQLLRSIQDKVVKDVLSKAYKMYYDNQLKDKEENEIYLHVWDCGGQLVYLNALPPFLSAVTAFLLIFDTTKELNSDVELIWNEKGKQLECHANLCISCTDLFRQWMAAIHSYVPRDLKILKKQSGYRVFIVGTHSQTCHQKEQHTSEACQKEQEKFGRDDFDRFFREEFKSATYINILEPHTKLVDNVKDSGDFCEIRNCVLDVADRFTVETPVTWVLFRIILERISEEEPLISLHKAYEVGEASYIDENKVHSVLNFYHELGVFLFYPKKDKDESEYIHEKCIIANPKWLVEKLGCLLCHEKQLLRLSTQPQYIHVQLFCNHGILVHELFDNVFKHCEDRKVILDILIRFYLAAEVTINLPPTLRGSNYNGQKGYFVPTMLSQSENVVEEPTDCHLSTDPLCLLVSSHNYLPPGFFLQLLVALTKKGDFKVRSSETAHNIVHFDYREKFIVCVSAKSNTHIEITLHRRYVRKTEDPYLCEICHDVLQDILSASNQLPLNKLLKDFKVQPALKCSVERAQYIEIKLNPDQTLEKNVECFEDRNVNPKAKLWLKRPYEVQALFGGFVCVFVMLVPARSSSSA